MRLVGSILVILVACNDTTSIRSTATPVDRHVANLTSVSTIDLSNGSAFTGRAWSIANNGVILGTMDGRGWWQAPSPVYTKIGDGYVSSGNRVGDAGGSQDHV